MCIRDRACQLPHRQRKVVVGLRDLQIAHDRVSDCGDTPDIISAWNQGCLLYTSDAADERSSVDLGGRRIIKKKTTNTTMKAGYSIKYKQNKEHQSNTRDKTE